MFGLDDLKDAFLNAIADDEDGDGSVTLRDVGIKFFDKDGDNDVDEDDLFVIKMHNQLKQAGKEIDIPELQRLIKQHGDDFIVFIKHLF
jgi:hypothetical protein